MLRQIPNVPEAGLAVEGSGVKTAKTRARQKTKTEISLSYVPHEQNRRPAI